MKCWYVVSLLFFILMGSACLWGGTVPKELQGSWSAGGDNGGHSWYIEYTIDDKSYKMQGYPSISASGNIELIEKKGSRYHLALSAIVFHGEAGKDRKMWVEIKDKGKTLQWEGHSLRKTASSTEK